MRHPNLLLAMLLMCGGAEGCLAAEAAPALYQRIADRLAQRPDLEHLGEAPAEMAAVDWLVGTWDIEVVVLATDGTPERHDHGRSTVRRVLRGTWLEISGDYPGGSQDLGFLGFDPVTRRWKAIALDGSGNALVSLAPGWRGDRLELIAEDAEIVGERLALRQTLQRHGDDAYEVVNEERSADGRWSVVDRYSFRRAAAAAAAP